MRVLICPQEFKGSLTAVEATDALANGVRQGLPDAVIDRCPIADGGPGTVEAVASAAGGRYTTTDVDGPLGDPVAARWARIPDSPASVPRSGPRPATPSRAHTAVIEMAAASGLLLVPGDRLDPRRASTYGTGQLLRAALDSGVGRILIGVGGSATNDAGAGAAVALGARFLDDDGESLPLGGAALARLARIDAAGLDPRLAATEIVVLADVTNPLLGPDGASAVYGPQKGADPATVAELERALTNFADVLMRDLEVDLAGMPGAGAAGGLAGGLVAFAGASIESGFRHVADVVRLASRAAAADLIVTGEGRLDRQSTFGKAVAGVATVALDASVPCLAVAGLVEDEEVVRAIPGLEDLEAATMPGEDLETALREAPQRVAAATAQLVARYVEERRVDDG
jgi:glycerate kinase